MAKNNRQSASPVNTAPAGNTVNRALLEKQLPSWKASFENASKFYQKTRRELDLAIDEITLKNIIKHIHGDDVPAVSTWLGKFAAVCSELAKYQSSLNSEYSARWEDCNQKGLQLELQEQSLAEEKEAFAQQQIQLEQNQQALKQQQQELAKQTVGLSERERDITQREQNAEAGFDKQNRESLAAQLTAYQAEKNQFTRDIALLQKQKNDLENNIALAKLRLTEAEQQRTTELTKQEVALASEKEELDRKTLELHKAQEQLQRSLQQLEKEKACYQANLDMVNEGIIKSIETQRHETEEKHSLQQLRLNESWADLKQAKQNIHSLIDEEMARERQSHQEQITQINKKLDSAWDKVDELQNQLSDFEELTLALGDQSPEAFMQQQTALKQEIRNLKRTLAESDSAALTEENEQLRQRVSELETSIKDMRPQLLQAQTEAAHKRIAATELQAVQQEKRVLEQHKNTLSVHIDDLESRIAQLTDAHKTQTPFPAMSNMDTAKDFRATLELEDVPDLSTFAKQLQHRIAKAEDHVELYYPIEDIRVLLGGLAMSQLHVFQGISGTGKTSLAKAFAKAMGGFCTDIAVQAGWRDRDDLLGHYNAFERKFYEKDCLQALYQAQTPRWSDTCNVILLDEMNLSRPEQYFSEFLSALEKNDHSERLISLAETTLPNAPLNLKDGRQILVSRNVWFIGTANHDETTNELADKTYDRAHVMTLPKQDHRFEITKYEKTNFSFRSLQRAFQQATQQHTLQVQELLEQLTNHEFTQQLADTFSLGWGNRFERQAKRFIPVMLACGASEGEALDHLLSTRVMRSGKVTGRYDVSADDIGLLSDALEAFWVASKLKGEPKKSLELLNADRQRKERGG